MISGGVSLRGSYHVEYNMPDQDSFWAGAVDGGWLLCVSDGVGSCAHSEIGSKALCKAARMVSEQHQCVIENPEKFIQEIHSAWIEEVQKEKFPILECCATALIGIVNASEVWGFRLGDGFLAVAAGEASTALLDYKTDYALNETDALADIFSWPEWEYFHIPRDKKIDFAGIIAATDGVLFEQDKDNLIRLVNEFSRGNAGLNEKEIEDDIRKWLPDYGGNDDTTLAFLLSETIHPKSGKEVETDGLG